MQIDPYTASNIGAILMSVVAFAASAKLIQTYRENKIHTIKFLGYFFGIFGVFQLIIGLRLVLKNILGASISSWYILAHLFLYISLAFFSRMSAYLVKPEWEKKSFYINIAAGILFTAVMLYQGTAVTPLIAIPSILNWIGLGTIVFLKMGREREGIERKKMWLMAVGFLLIALSGPLHNLAKTGAARIAVNLFTVTGTVLAMLGVYLKELLSPK